MGNGCVWSEEGAGQGRAGGRIRSQSRGQGRGRDGVCVSDQGEARSDMRSRELSVSKQIWIFWTSLWSVSKSTKGQVGT